MPPVHLKRTHLKADEILLSVETPAAGDVSALDPGESARPAHHLLLLRPSPPHLARALGARRNDLLLGDAPLQPPLDHLVHGQVQRAERQNVSHPRPGAVKQGGQSAVLKRPPRRVAQSRIQIALDHELRLDQIEGIGDVSRDSAGDSARDDLVGLADFGSGAVSSSLGGGLILTILQKGGLDIIVNSQFQRRIRYIPQPHALISGEESGNAIVLPYGRYRRSESGRLTHLHTLLDEFSRDEYHRRCHVGRGGAAEECGADVFLGDTIGDPFFDHLVGGELDRPGASIGGDVRSQSGIKSADSLIGEDLATGGDESQARPGSGLLERLDAIDRMEARVADHGRYRSGDGEIGGGEGAPPLFDDGGRFGGGFASSAAAVGDGSGGGLGPGPAVVVVGVESRRRAQGAGAEGEEEGQDGQEGAAEEAGGGGGGGGKAKVAKQQKGGKTTTNTKAKATGGGGGNNNRAETGVADGDWMFNRMGSASGLNLPGVEYGTIVFSTNPSGQCKTSADCEDQSCCMA
mmetsp:Transcript_30569/g.91362  ORF Transcript_30569/g.91362 Transcript_30569/m.91362 type:complete len:519 (-) Transcript_30569:598-2154(-)